MHNFKELLARIVFHKEMDKAVFLKEEVQLLVVQRLEVLGQGQGCQQHPPVSFLPMITVTTPQLWGLLEVLVLGIATTEDMEVYLAMETREILPMVVMGA